MVYCRLNARCRWTGRYDAALLKHKFIAYFCVPCYEYAPTLARSTQYIHALGVLLIRARQKIGRFNTCCHSGSVWISPGFASQHFKRTIDQHSELVSDYYIWKRAFVSAGIIHAINVMAKLSISTHAWTTHRLVICLLLEQPHCLQVRKQ